MVVVPIGQGSDEVERPEGERGERAFHPARDRRVHLPVADGSQRLTEGNGSGRARIGRGQDRAADAKGNAQVGRGGATEYRKCQGRRDLPDPAADEPLVLLLGERDAAQGAAQVDPHPVCVGLPRRARLEGRIGERHPTRRDGKLAEPVQAANRPGVHVVRGFEGVDLGGNPGMELRGIEAVDGTDGRGRRPQPGAERVHPDSHRGDKAEAGDPDPSGIGHPSPASASARVLNTSSVRPAMGRVNSRSTTTAQARRRGRKSCSMVTRHPPSVLSIRQVTSIPRVAPATC